jgi:hypothetical protein
MMHPREPIRERKSPRNTTYASQLNLDIDAAIIEQVLDYLNQCVGLSYRREVAALADT